MYFPTFRFHWRDILPWRECIWCGRCFWCRRLAWVWCWIRWGIPEHCCQACAMAEADFWCCLPVDDLHGE